MQYSVNLYLYTIKEIKFVNLLTDFFYLSIKIKKVLFTAFIIQYL